MPTTRQRRWLLVFLLAGSLLAGCKAFAPRKTDSADDSKPRRWSLRDERAIEVEDHMSRNQAPFGPN
jgi:hypothetical protein